MLWLKAAVLPTLFVPGLLTAFWLATDQLGGRPVMAAIHGTGLWAIRLVLISLAITPFARALDWPNLLLVRRMVGVAAACYAGAHLALYVVDQNFRLTTVASEIAVRFYLTIGFVALLGLIALAATSTDAAMRRMRRNWKRLHRLAYPIGAIALLHYFIQSKLNVSEPVFVAGLFLWLMLWRLLPETWTRTRSIAALTAVYAGLAMTAGVMTAAVEIAWYGLATRIDPWRVVTANETLAHGVRPAHWVLLCGLGGLAIVTLRHILPLPRRQNVIA
ncbi:MAG TPA: ferric reductase-like transmembrane domain-containing protein [Rhodopila sp.]|jgi:sulfoxide reductase heme-binding subunit YedZ|nr:ferric reductase-like transmembrane domain-containing protein [Rhodopila sp.]